MDDNFEDDSVIVVLKNNNSRKLNSYTTKSFPEISTASSVKDLTSYTKDRIVSQRNKKAKAKSNIEKELLSSNDEMYVDEERFHQIIKIDIKTKARKMY